MAKEKSDFSSSSMKEECALNEEEMWNGLSSSHVPFVSQKSSFLFTSDLVAFSVQTSHPSKFTLVLGHLRLPLAL